MDQLWQKLEKTDYKSDQDNNRELRCPWLLVSNSYIQTWIKCFMKYRCYTLFPNISFKGLSPSAVMDEVIWAVKADINSIPIIIQSEA